MRMGSHHSVVSGLEHAAAGAGLLRPGGTLGRWRIDEVLGRGGMGVVYRASHDGRTFALKVVHPQLLGRKQFLKRFQREAESGARVRHPNVVRTFGVESCETPGGLVHALVMEYVHGRTLADLQAALGRVPEGLLRDVAAQVAAGLGAIHDAGVIHRDLKPENVLLTDAHEVKIMDLGLARLRDEEVRLSRTGQFIGSLLFAAPEQLGDNDGLITPAADLYALGLVLYQLAAGRAAFEVDTVAAIVRSHLTETPPLLRTLVPELSPLLESVVATLLKKDPAERFESAKVVQQTLETGEASAWWRARRGDASGGLAAPSRLGPPLLGRARELRELLDGWARAQQGRGGTCLLVAEEGLGRSRLLEAFVEAAGVQADTMLSVGVLEAGESPLSALGAALAAALPPGEPAAAVKDLLPGRPDAQAALGAWLADPARTPVPSPALEGEDGPIVDLVLGLARRRPRVVLVDDLDRLPEREQDQMRALAAAAHAHPLLVVAAVAAPLDRVRREAWLAVEGVLEVPLGRLADDAMRALLEAHVGVGPTAQTLTRELLPRAGGSPGVLNQLLDGLQASGALRRGAAGAWVLEQDGVPRDLPASVRALVERRLAGLAPVQRLLLDAACVQGRTFDVRVVAAALGQPLLQVLEDLVPLGRDPRLVRGEGRTRAFEPLVVQEAAYDALTPERRAELHRAAAAGWEAVLASGEEPRAVALPRVAGHRLAGGQALLAAPIVLEALDALLAARRNTEALDLSQAAAEAGDALGPVVLTRVLTRRARLLELLGRRAEERTCLEAALAAHAAFSDVPPASQLLALGCCLVALGEVDAARARFREQAVRSDAAGDGLGRAVAALVLARADLATGDVKGARLHAERALLAARAAGHRALEVEGLGLVARVFERQGRIEAAVEHQERRLALGAREGDVRQACNARAALARLAFGRGRWNEARVHLDRAGALARELGHRRGEARALMGLGLVAAALGRLGEAQDQLEAARRAALAAGDLRTESAASVEWARLSVRRGEAHSALPLLLRTLGAAGRRGESAHAALACLGAAEAAIVRGEGAEAESWCADALAQGGTLGERLDMDVRLAQARAALLQGRRAAALEPLGRATAIAARNGWCGTLAVAAALRSAAGGDLAQAVHLWTLHADALTWWERLEVHRAIHLASGDAWHAAQAERLAADMALRASTPGTSSPGTSTAPGGGRRVA